MNKIHFKVKKTTSKKSSAKDERPVITLKVDAKTIIRLRTKDALKLWLAKYPNAEVIYN